MVLKQIFKSFEVARQRNWDQIYYFYDIHETILVPDYNNLEPLRFYPYAKEALQLMTKHPMLVNILYTCSHPEEIKKYQEFFRENDIEFSFVNENPLVTNTNLGCFDSKPYMSCLFEDKAGFDTSEWRNIYTHFAELAGIKPMYMDFKYLYPNDMTNVSNQFLKPTDETTYKDNVPAQVDEQHRSFREYMQQHLSEMRKQNKTAHQVRSDFYRSVFGSLDDKPDLPEDNLNIDDK